MLIFYLNYHYRAIYVQYISKKEEESEIASMNKIFCLRYTFLLHFKLAIVHGGRNNFDFLSGFWYGRNSNEISCLIGIQTVYHAIFLSSFIKILLNEIHLWTSSHNTISHFQLLSFHSFFIQFFPHCLVYAIMNHLKLE